ncbi:bacterial regulatory, Fis family protein [Bacteroides fragilis str. S23 R14]|uniref:sigma-54-dependent transcriptional regulator n=1 Tax=Bacteroides fragilis TaxID=817 RepID=UPI0004462445|nr:sigma-54 dependent transcriptional regulator [Bacteroides fragilis]EXZ97977.1 bacterial regulatory, Fis family protein [Bacteroides fragilis str. S23 R14]EYA64105.1 bacterial regulatory, Fis family protein [Bacteroides fragilis str. S23L24]EYE41234.1 bacterial regulatory, Fis family protein [Bacteroides fragilis str. S23L17]
MKEILIVEDNLSLSALLKGWLKKKGYAAAVAIDEPKARKLLQSRNISLVLADVRLPEGNGIALLEWMRAQHLYIPYVVMTSYATVAEAVRAIKLGAVDYLSKPVDKERLLALTGELTENPTVHACLTNHFQRDSPQARYVEKAATLVAPSDLSVVILGANGTGKEAVAHTIHLRSTRRGMPFVAVNCGAIPQGLAESYFFGHVKGAFTSADSNKEGCFHEAEGGTLFLDEIGDLPERMQALLLRVLQEKRYCPVGSSRERKADVRIVAATNADLPRAIREGTFREDLYHRICEFEIEMPTLAECREDILPLAGFFREQFSKELKKETEGFDTVAQEMMLAYGWPGNIRELRRRTKRAVLLAEGVLIRCEDLGLGTNVAETGRDEEPLPALNGATGEKWRILEALKRCGGNKKEAARLLGIDRATLYRKIKKYELQGNMD